MSKIGKGFTIMIRGYLPRRVPTLPRSHVAWATGTIQLDPGR